MSENDEIVKRLNNARGILCPFDSDQPDPGLEITDPCPVCGDLGSVEPFGGKDHKPPMCIHGDARKAAQAIERLEREIEITKASLTDAEKAEQQLAEARAEIERLRKILKRVQGGLDAGVEAGVIAAGTYEYVNEALAAPAPGKDSEGKE